MENAMKIGFDISQTGNNKAGCGYFADSLIRELADSDRQNEYILYPQFGINHCDPKAARETRKIDQKNFSSIRVGMKFEEAMAFWRNLPINGEDRLGNPDIIHANNFFCPKGLKKAKIVYTLYDLSFLEYPELTTEQNRVVCFEGVFNASIYADFVVAISHYSREKYLEIFPHYPAERVRVVHLASRFSTGGSRKVISRILKGIKPGEFWLSVGTLEPRKNLRRLLKAFALYRKRARLSYPLILSGGTGWLEDDLEQFIEKLGIADSVRILGYVSDEELCWLYENCYAFAFLSLYEGFGLPVLEAMSLGAAVITSDNTSLPEVAGEAAYYVNATNEEDIVQAFNKLEDNENYRLELKEMAIKQSIKFSWNKSAAKVLEIYRQVMDIPKFAGNSE
jgi:glycosyltransferase involved in cell wall biosynthesis